MQSHNHSNSPAPLDSKNMPALSMDTSQANLSKVTDGCPLCGVQMISCDCILDASQATLNCLSHKFADITNSEDDSSHQPKCQDIINNDNKSSHQPNVRISLMTGTTTPAISPNVAKLTGCCASEVAQTTGQVRLYSTRAGSEAIPV